MSGQQRRYVGWQVRHSCVRVSSERHNLSGDILQIRGKPGSYTTLFRRSIDADEDEVRFLDPLVDIGREEQIAAARLLDNVYETRFINGQEEVRTIPRVNAGLVEIDDGDSNVWTFESNNSACWAAWEEDDPFSAGQVRESFRSPTYPAPTSRPCTQHNGLTRTCQETYCSKSW